MIGPSKALFMDEISTGLDSSSTFQGTEEGLILDGKAFVPDRL